MKVSARFFSNTNTAVPSWALTLDRRKAYSAKRAKRPQTSAQGIRIVKKAAVAACGVGVLFFALAASAADLDYPSLGVKLTNLPGNARGGGVIELLRQDQVEILFGGMTSARVSRHDEPVPQGNIADKGYRDALFKQLGIHRIGGALPPVLIAGQPAWGIGSVQRFGAEAAEYQCVFYLVVGGHLYEIEIFAGGDPWRAKRNFHAAAEEVTSGLLFEPVRPLPEKPLAPGEMPRFLPESSMDPPYPEGEWAAGEQGVVDVEFRIDGRGVAQDVKVTNDAARDFSKVVVSTLRSGGFKIPPGWEQSAASKERFTMEFRFQLGCPATFPLPKAPRQVVTICQGSARTPE